MTFAMKELCRDREATELTAECAEVQSWVLGSEHPHTALTEWQSVE
jgi:hypothetical protein